MGDLVLHIVLLLALPPLLLGVIQRTKAIVAGRTGAPLLQPYRDVWKLLRKGAVYSRTTSPIFVAGPIVALATALGAGLIVPLVAARAPLTFAGDVIAFAYLLGLGRFFTMAAALDTGSSFEGMGASREAAFSALAEPALFIALGIVCIPAGSVSFAEVWGALAHKTGLLEQPELLAAALVLFAVVLAENSRIPVDDPNTHLELTMIHEVMVLDHGGPDLAFVLYGSAVKLFVLVALPVHLLLPFPSSGVAAGAALLVAGELGAAVAIGVVESVMARLRLARVPELLVGASVLGAIGLLAALVRGVR
jgi:formate hydrogenlyase subunit 4